MKDILQKRKWHTLIPVVPLLFLGIFCVFTAPDLSWFNESHSGFFVGRIKYDSQTLISLFWVGSGIIYLLGFGIKSILILAGRINKATCLCLMLCFFGQYLLSAAILKGTAMQKTGMSDHSRSY